ncbi:hypothetical protein SPAN111604_14395 [Sphingomonas antarctica]
MVALNFVRTVTASGDRPGHLNDSPFVLDTSMAPLFFKSAVEKPSGEQGFDQGE